MLTVNSQILHVLASSVSSAEKLLSAALQAGFRESGASSLESSCPMVAVRCQGLAFDCIIGRADANGINIEVLVSEDYLRTMARVVNERFATNSERLRRFENAVKALNLSSSSPGRNVDLAREKELRRTRKRAEGLERQRKLRQTKGHDDIDNALGT